MLLLNDDAESLFNHAGLFQLLNKQMQKDNSIKKQRLERSTESSLEFSRLSKSIVLNDPVLKQNKPKGIYVESTN